MLIFNLIQMNNLCLLVSYSFTTYMFIYQYLFTYCLSFIFIIYAYLKSLCILNF